MTPLFLLSVAAKTARPVCRPRLSLPLCIVSVSRGKLMSSLPPRSRPVLVGDNWLCLPWVFGVFGVWSLSRRTDG